MSRTRDPLKPVYALGGDDRPKVERALRRLSTRVQQEGGLPAEVMSAADTPAADVVAACEALSFGGTRLVVVPDADRWRADDLAPLLTYLAAPNPGSCLALVYDGAPPQKLGNAVRAVGDILQFGPDPKAKPKDRTAWFVKHLVEEVRRHGATITAALARDVVTRVGEDATALTGEAAKLAAYAGDEPVTRDMVDAIVVTHPDAATWDLTDALAARNAARAYDVLQDFATGDHQREPIAVALALARHYRGVAAAQALGDRATGDAIAELTGLKGYPATKAAEHARALPPGAGEKAVARLARLELDLRVSSLTRLGRTPGDGQRFVLELAARDLLRLADG
ncbi:MAG: DNA polymerase III subunit delta [Actinomycetota bacterium]